MSKPTEPADLGSLEIELLRGLVDPAGERTIEKTETAGDVDWQRVLRALKRHGLGPLAHRNLTRAGAAGSVPIAVSESLENLANLELAKAIVRLHHLDEIAARAAASKKSICLLKGIAFATALYEHPAERPMTDIDLLVEPSDIEGWRVELETLGYELEDASDHALCFRRRRSGIYVELHRALTSCSRYLGLDVGPFMERARSAPGFPKDGFVKTLRWEDHLLHLCLHASFQHGFRQPAINAWDARLVSQQAALDWGEFREISRPERIAGWVYGGLVMSQAVFPGESLVRAIGSVEEYIPRRVLNKGRTMTASRLLSASRESVFGTPFLRLTWDESWLKKLPLLLEILQPRDTREKNASWPSPRRAWQLVYNHAIKRIRAALFDRLFTPLGPTPASLGEIRDV